MSRVKSDIISRALEIAYPSQNERDAALRRFSAMPPHHRDTVRTLLRLALDAEDKGRALPDIPDWLAREFAEQRKGKPGRKTRPAREAEGWKKAVAEAPRPKPKAPPKDARSLPEFTYEERSGTATARTVKACARCGAHPKADEGLQRIGGRLLCPKCAAARFKAVNTPHPDELNVEMGKI